MADSQADDQSAELPRATLDRRCHTMLHRPPACVSKTAISAGARALRDLCGKSPFNSNNLGTPPGRRRALRVVKKTGAGERSAWQAKTESCPEWRGVTPPLCS